MSCSRISIRPVGKDTFRFSASSHTRLNSCPISQFGGRDCRASSMTGTNCVSIIQRPIVACCRTRSHAFFGSRRCPVALALLANTHGVPFDAFRRLSSIASALSERGRVIGSPFLLSGIRQLLLCQSICSHRICRTFDLRAPVRREISK